MDEYDGSAPPASILDSNEENMNSAPPQIQPTYPSEDEIKLNQETKDPNQVSDNNNNENNNNNDNNEEEDDEEYVPVRPVVQYHYDEIGKYRIITQYVFCFILYGCSIFGISLNCVYGAKYSLIDDVFLFILPSIMLYLTIKKRSTFGTKLGLSTLGIWLLGLAPRVVDLFFLSEGRKLFTILMIIRIVALVPVIYLNYSNFCQC